MADQDFSERRACRLVGVNWPAWQYELLCGKDDAIRERMREIANERRRFGYLPLSILLRHEGKGMKPTAHQLVERAKRNPKYPTGSRPDQQSLSASTT